MKLQTIRHAFGYIPGMRALLPLCLAISCAAEAPPEPAPKDWSAAHAGLLERVPGDAGVFAVADTGHFLERLEAILKLAMVAPSSRQEIEPLLAQLKERVGWDVWDPKAWAANGLDLHAPFAFVVDLEKPYVVLGAADNAKLGATLEKLLPSIHCIADGKWEICGDANVQAPHADKQQSLWTRITQTVPADVQKMEALTWIPLKKLVADAKLEFARASEVAWLGMRFDEQQIRMRGGYVNPELRGIEKYLHADPGAPSLLGAAKGGEGAMRMGFSPQALWALAQEKLPGKELDQVSGVVAMATGLDLEKDIVKNFTGEIVSALTPTGIVMFLGTRDDERTQRFLEKMDGLMSGVAAMAKQQEAKTKVPFAVERTVDELHGAKFYHYNFKMSGEAMKLDQPIEYELHWTAAHGAILYGMDRLSLQQGVKQLGRPASAFLDELTPERRARFQSDAVAVAYFASVDPMRVITKKQLNMAKPIYDKIAPGVWPILMGLMGSWELIWDSELLFTCKNGKMELDYLARLL
jgi:hypothetical protein